MPAYAIVDANVHDPEGMKGYLEKVGATLAPFSGTPLVVGSDIEVMEGDWTPKRLVVVQFPTMADARGWYESAAYQEILPLRLNASNDKFVFVEGV